MTWNCKCQSGEELWDFDKKKIMTCGYMNKQMYCSDCGNEIKYKHSLKNKLLIGRAIAGIPGTFGVIILSTHLFYCAWLGQSAFGSWCLGL